MQTGGTTVTTIKNFAIAGAAVISPFWLGLLKDASEIAAALMPFFGIALIIMQMRKLKKRD